MSIPDAGSSLFSPAAGRACAVADARLVSHNFGRVVNGLPLDSVQLPGPSSNYTGNYVSLPAAMLRPPVEGNRSVPISILWLRDGMAPGYTVLFDATSQRVVPISQISAVYIDNTINVANVVLVFPDTNFAITAPANSSGYYPVVSNQLRFYAFCEVTPASGDRTYIQVLNFLPPALALASGPAQGTSLGTVTQISTVSPILGGPITTQGTISLDSNALLQLIESYPDVHLTGTLEVNGATTLAATETGNLDVDGSLTIGEPAGPAPASGGMALMGPVLINHNLAAPPPPAFAMPLTMIQLVGGDGLHEPNIEMDGFGGSPSLIMRRAGGTGAIPSGTLPNQSLLALQARGYGATGWGVGLSNLNMYSAEQFTDTAQGTRLQIDLVAPGTITQTSSALTLDGVGNLAIAGPAANNAIKPGGGSWSAPSDPRLKEDVEPYSAGLDEVLALEPVEYSYNGKAGTRRGGQRWVGLDAEHARDILPSLVGTMAWAPSHVDESGELVLDGPEDEFLTVDPSQLVFTLINAVKTLTDRLERLETAVRAAQQDAQGPLSRRPARRA